MNKNKVFSESGKKGANIRWETYHKKFISNLNSRENKLAKSILCGFLAGDGTVSARSDKKYPSLTHYDIKFYPDDINQANVIRETFRNLYAKDIKIEKAYDSENYVLRTKHKPACIDLLKTAKFGVHRWRVPISLLSSKELRAYWLKAFFSAEGHVNPKVKCIQLQTVNKAGLEDVKTLLKGFGIQSRIYSYQRKNPRWNINFILNINKENSILFNKYVGFYSHKKQKELGNIAEVAEPG